MSTQAFAGRFADKVLVVTGAAQGIGRALALRAAKEGGKVLLVDRSHLVSEVVLEAEGAEVATFTCDLESYQGAHSAMQFAAETFGGIDILINNVGGAIRMRPFAEFESPQIDAEIRRSLMPTLYCCHAVLPHLFARNGGTIVNVSSNATRGIHRMPYSAAKGGGRNGLGVSNFERSDNNNCALERNCILILSAIELVFRDRFENAGRDQCPLRALHKKRFRFVAQFKVFFHLIGVEKRRQLFHTC